MGIPTSAILVIDTNTGDTFRSDDERTKEPGRAIESIISRRRIGKSIESMSNEEKRVAAVEGRGESLTAVYYSFIDTEHPPAQRSLFETIETRVRRRRGAASPAKRILIDALIVDLNSWEQWLNTIYRDLMTAVVGVRAGTTLTEAYATVSIDLDPLRATKPTVDAVSIIQQFRAINS